MRKIALVVLLLCLTGKSTWAAEPSVAPAPEVPAITSEIKDAIELKKQGKSDEFILDKLASDMQQKLEAGDSRKIKYFNKGLGGNIPASDLAELTKAGFSEESQRKLLGLPQYLTLGVSAVWLFKTADFVPVPMLRIFLTPKSYYEPRMPIFSKEIMNTGGWLVGQLEKIDANIGYSAIQSKTKSGEEEKSDFVLTGIAYELNKSALVNFGRAFATKDVSHNRNQWYLGITVDYNVLKALGI